MGLDRDTVVCADIDVHAYDPARRTEHFKQRRKENHRAAACDAGLDDHFRPSAPDDLLHRDQILRVLDDGQTQPREVVGISVPAAGVEPVA